MQYRSFIAEHLSRVGYLVLAVLLVISMGGCSLFRGGEKDETDVEKLRLKYQKGKMGALLQIIEIYEDPEQPLSARLAAARALGESRHPKAMDALAQNIRNAENLDIDMMLESIDILAAIPSHESGRAFIEALASTDMKLNQLRTKLVEGLESVGSEDYIQSLIDLYQSTRENQLRMEQMLTTALGNIGDNKAIPVLIDIASDPAVSLGTRSTAIEILAKKKSPEVVQLFAQ
ncbi:MAG: HEAT repeat domain-containing protein, partial [Candidatus Marinimicrobia bacterium]|nr:HEAT repeat domain-containing protein [Candidatus Neomarinimicrobiota bacterium]